MGWVGLGWVGLEVILEKGGVGVNPPHLKGGTGGQSPPVG